MILEILILGVVALPLLTSIFLKISGKFLNELLTNFITINAALLSVGLSSFMFGYIFLEKFKPLKFELFESVSYTHLTLPTKRIV